MSALLKRLTVLAVLAASPGLVGNQKPVVHAVWNAADSAASPQQVAGRVLVSSRLDDSGVRVTVSNAATVSLEAWTIEVFYRTTTGRPESLEVSIDTAPSAPPDSRPLPAGGSRDRFFPIPGIETLEGHALKMAFFEDGTWDGSAELKDAVLGRRDQQAALLAGWLAAINSALAAPETAYDALARRLANESALSRGTDIDSGRLALQETIRGVLNQADQSPQSFVQTLRALAEHFQMKRADYLRHRRR